MAKVLKRILYVEDEPDIQQIAQIALQKVGGFEVKICSSGSEALAEVPGFNPDLILLDVMMPEMDGPQTYEALKKIPDVGRTPVIIYDRQSATSRSPIVSGFGCWRSYPQTV